MMFPFTYHVRYWDYVDNIVRVQQGVTFGETFAAAMANVESHYGTDMIECSIVGVSEAQNVIELSAREVQQLESEF